MMRQSGISRTRPEGILRGQRHLVLKGGETGGLLRADTLPVVSGVTCSKVALSAQEDICNEDNGGCTDEDHKVLYAY